MEKTRREYNRTRPKTMLRIFAQKVLNILARYAILPQLRIALYRLMGVKIGKGVFIGLDCYLDDQYPEQIIIGDYAIISPRAILLTHDMPDWDVNNKDGSGKVATLTIGSRVYVCAGAILLPGVTVGEHSVVAAGAVVVSDVAPYTLVAGVPAVKKKNLNAVSDGIKE